MTPEHLSSIEGPSREVRLTPEQIELLSHFLEALDEWGCDDNMDRANHIADFIAGGFDLTAYEEGRPDILHAPGRA